MNLIVEFLKEITIGGIIVGAFTYLAKRTIDHLFARDVESHKARLQKETSDAIASYRATLEKEQMRLQIAYGGIYEKQADAILELYKLLTKFERLMYLATNPGNDSVEYPEFIEVWNRLMQVYDESQVLLTEAVDHQVGEIAKSIFTAVHDVRRVEDKIGKIGHTLSQEQFDRLYKNQGEAYEILNRIPEIKTELKAQMRRLLGIHHSQEQAISDP